jgi:hypothetical protein
MRKNHLVATQAGLKIHRLRDFSGIEKHMERNRRKRRAGVHLVKTIAGQQFTFKSVQIVTALMVICNVAPP